ncbi:MAG: isoprenyl transferase [Prochlorothrix sp.]|nr:isoprenyl transferase [Prochlorothrix sp.]
MTVQDKKATTLPKDLNPKQMPRHVAVIMDGNGRWAQRRGLARLFGHRQGAIALRNLVACCSEWGIGTVTAYAFSTENWGRPQTEVNFLMELFNEYVLQETASMMQNGIRLRVVGDMGQLPTRLQDNLQAAIDRTRHNTNIELIMALNYSGRQEITQACRHIATQVQQGKLAPEDINDDLFGRYLFTQGVSDPDLLIRTSGEMRISNFLLWQLAYTEIYVTPTLWPDFDRSEFHQALCDYQKRQRRFGKL